MTLNPEMPKASELWIEVTKDTYHSPHFLRKMSEVQLAKIRGFRSIYLYTQGAVDHMLKQETVGGISRFPVYSDTLFVDFDDGDSSSTVFEGILNAQGIAYSMYFSGRKGHHFHIPIEPMFHTEVPHSQKMWVNSLGLRSVDLSIYRHTGLFRLPGTIHKITGNKKELLKEVHGNVLTIPIIPRSCSDISVEHHGDSEFASALQISLRSFIDEPGPGGRHVKLVSIAKRLLQSGMSPSATEEFITIVNSLWSNPKPDEEIAECVRRAIRWHNADLR
jgi:hypothetical protein